MVKGYTFAAALLPAICAQRTGFRRDADRFQGGEEQADHTPGLRQSAVSVRRRLDHHRWDGGLAPTGNHHCFGGEGCHLLTRERKESGEV